MTETPSLSQYALEAIVYSYGIDTPAKARMVEAFVANPTQKPFTSLLSYRISKSSSTHEYRHAFYPKSIIRLSTPWIEDPQAASSIKMDPQNHAHYMEEWVIPNQGNRYTPNVEMYVRLSTGETLAIMENLIPPSSNNEGLMTLFREELKMITGTDKKRRPKGYQHAPKGFKELPTVAPTVSGKAVLEIMGPISLEAVSVDTHTGNICILFNEPSCSNWSNSSSLRSKLLSEARNMLITSKSPTKAFAVMNSGD